MSADWALTVRDLEEEEHKREENFRGYSKEDLSLKFLKKHFMENIFGECERKINHNLDIILSNELSEDLWDFSSFYDRILEQREIMKNHFEFRSPVQVIKQKIASFFVSDKRNFNKGLRMLEQLAGGSSRVHFRRIWRTGDPRFRTDGDGSEKIVIPKDEYMSNYRKRQNLQKMKLGELKKELRGSIKAEQLVPVILFEELEKHFPVKDYKILLKAEKLGVIQRMLTLMDRLVRSGLVDNKQRIEKQSIQLENKMYYDNNEEDSDDDMGGGFGGMGNLFGMMSRRKRKKNIALNALKKRKCESVVDHSLLANLMDKLGSLGYESLELFTLVFQRDGLLRHRKTMEKVLKSMLNYVRLKKYDYRELQSIFEIFEKKICFIQNKLDTIKAKYASIFGLRRGYKSKLNRARAGRLLQSYRRRFVKWTGFMRVVIRHKVQLFKQVFETLYEKTFSETTQLPSQHVKMCLQNEELTGKWPSNPRRHHFAAALPGLLGRQLGGRQPPHQGLDDPAAVLQGPARPAPSALGKPRARTDPKINRSLTEIIYWETNYGSFFDRLFRVMKEYLGQEISVKNFELLRFNPGLAKVKQIFKLFFRSEDLVDFDSLFAKFADKYDETVEYLGYFKSFLETPFVRKCSDFRELSDELQRFEQAVQEQPILAIQYSWRLEKIKKDYISLITSDVFLNVLNKLYHKNQKTAELTPDNYLDFGSLSFLEIEALFQVTSNYLERLFSYRRDSRFQKKLLLRDVRQIFQDIDVESELALFKARYDAKLEGLFDLLGQSRFVQVSLEFSEGFQPIYDFFELKNQESTEQLVKFKQFYLEKGEDSVFWDLREKYAKMRVFAPSEEEAEVPDLKTELELEKVNPLFLLVENHVNVVYFLQVLSENIELTAFLMEIYKNFLDSFESKIDILNEEIQAGDYSIKNFHLVDCKHLIRHLKEVSGKNFNSDHQFLMHFLTKNIIEGKVKDLVKSDAATRAYPNYLRIVNRLSKNALYKKDYGRHR